MVGGADARVWCGQEVGVVVVREGFGRGQGVLGWADEFLGLSLNQLIQDTV